MTATITIDLEPAEADLLFESLLFSYSEAATSVDEAFGGDAESLPRVVAARDALRQVEHVIDCLGWQFGDRTAPVSLAAPYSLLRDRARWVVADYHDRVRDGSPKAAGLPDLRKRADLLGVALSLVEKIDGAVEAQYEQEVAA